MGKPNDNAAPKMPENYAAVENSAHLNPPEHRLIDETNGDKIMATLILRRQPGGQQMKDLTYFQSTAFAARGHLSHEDFASRHGAAQHDIDKVKAFATGNGLEVVEASRARRSVVVRGTAAQINKAFAVKLCIYDSKLGQYRGHEGPVHLPAEIRDIVETIFGLDNRKVPAKHFTGDPPHTVNLTPQEVATLYNFPAGDGSGQTIGIYEMVTSDGAPGYAAADIEATIKAFGGGLRVPVPVDVAIDGQVNTGVSDGETLLDITVCGAIANGAGIAVYFTGADGGSNQDIIHALQRMIHPGAGDPVPTVISISYGFTPDEVTDFVNSAEFAQMSQLFQDAAHLGITVLVSSGDSGVKYLSRTVAEASYPATDPWVIACGGTTIGDVNGMNFTEFIWNDTFGSNKGATGGGVSGFFELPAYQKGFPVPKSLAAGKVGRGIPDLAGNASPVSGYEQVAAGQQGATGGTSAVAPLYAGLIAVINANLQAPVGFINPQLYALAETCFHEISSPPGPADNSFDGVKGYPATKGWNACTGLGSVNGVKLQALLKSSAGSTPSEVKAANMVAAAH